MEAHVDEAITSGLGSDQRTTPVQSLAGEDTLPAVPLRSIGAKHPADLSRRNTNITSRNIGVGTDVLAQFTHESYAELANLVVRLALGIEICSSLAAAHLNFMVISFQLGW
jgi:hypothetical protein